jgi:LPS-assembly protein
MQPTAHALPLPDAIPDWFARTTDLRLDYDDETGTARNATLYFKGMPILYSPWMSFSLNHERKSGLLTPTFGSTSRGGIEYTQPFYWNISQNMDATIAPRFMAKRGTLWKGEYRYMQPNYSGTMQGQYLPEDKLEQQVAARSYSIYPPARILVMGFPGSLALNGASDDTYFTDLANGSSVVAQTNSAASGHAQLFRRYLVVGEPPGAELSNTAGSVPAAGDRALQERCPS